MLQVESELCPKGSCISDSDASRWACWKGLDSEGSDSSMGQLIDRVLMGGCY